MLMKLHLGLVALCALPALCTSSGGAGGSLLRKEEHGATQEVDPNTLLKLLVQKIEVLEKQSQDYGLRIEELENTIEILQSEFVASGRHLQNSECTFLYNSVTRTCTANNTFAFNHPVEMKKDLTVKGKLTMEGDAEVALGSMLEANGAVMLHRGLAVDGGLVTVDSTMQIGNITVSGTTFVGKSIFMDPVEFKDTIKVESSATFQRDVLFTGFGEVCFENAFTRFKDEAAFEDLVHFYGDDVGFDSDVTFYKDVNFKDNVEFHDDVAVLGPTTSSDSDDFTGFKIKGYVNVDFENKLPMDVYSETRFRDDVNLVHGSSSSTDTASTTQKRTESSRTSSDYSDWSHDTVPQLKVQGDITTESNLRTEKNLFVEGNTFLTGTRVNVQSDLTVGGTTTLNGDTTVGSGNFAVASGTTTLTGNTAITGSTTLNGNLEVSGGTAKFNGETTVQDANLVVVGNVDINANTMVPAVGGNLEAEGTITAGA